MTQARFLSNNSVNCEANRLKLETLMHGCLAQPLKVFQIGLEVRPLRATLSKSGNYQKVEIFDILGRIPTPAQIEVKFCTAKRTQVPNFT